MRIAVIGGAGRMGRWLVEYFLNQGHEVTLSDARREEAKAVSESTGATLARNNAEAVKNADLSVISTPIEVVPKVLKEIAPKLKESSAVMEISSIKSRLIPVLEELAKHKVSPLSVHPLFGPGVQKLDEEKIVLVPVVDPISEMKLAARLFPTAEIVVVDAEEHDRAMALTLSLPHFVNMVFASVISEEDLNVLKKLGGTTFALQLVTSESVMTEDPDVYASIQIDNEYTTQCLNSFMSNAKTLKGYIDRKDPKSFSQFYRDICSSLSKDPDFPKAYEKMYGIRKALKDPF